MRKDDSDFPRELTSCRIIISRKPNVSAFFERKTGGQTVFAIAFAAQLLDIIMIVIVGLFAVRGGRRCLSILILECCT